MMSYLKRCSIEASPEADSPQKVCRIIIGTRGAVHSRRATICININGKPVLKEIKRAKLLLWIVFVALTGLDLVLLLKHLFHGNVPRAASISIRFWLTVGLLFFVYRGHLWARIVTGLLLLIATISSAFAAISLHSLLFWALLCPYAFALYVVGFSPSVRQFLAKQRAPRASSQLEAPASTCNERNLHQH